MDTQDREQPVSSDGATSPGQPAGETDPLASQPAPPTDTGTVDAPSAAATDSSAAQAATPPPAPEDAEATGTSAVSSATTAAAPQAASPPAAPAQTSDPGDGLAWPESVSDPRTTAVSFTPPTFEETPPSDALASLELLDDVELDVKVELGRAEMYIEDVLRLTVGSVIELDKLAGDPVDIYVNERLVARGEVLVLNDSFCVRVNDIVSPVPSPED